MNSAPSLSLLAVSWKSHTLTKLLECSMLTNQTINLYYNFTISLKGGVHRLNKILHFQTI